MSLSVIIVDKVGEFKTLNIKNYCENELYKKCGFKKDTNFVLQTTWNISLNDMDYNISMYGKTDGKKNFENISNFPYPINNKIFYGSCALVASSGENKINLSIELWKQLHKKITEGEDLNSFSFVNLSQITVKSTTKQEKQKKKEQEKERDDKNILEINSVAFQELEEDNYCYSSDEADFKQNE
jgi:hypothetical protein